MRTNLKLLDEIFNKFKEGGWTARKAQQALQEYRKRGGKYTQTSK